MDETTMNNAIALFEEMVANGEDKETLFAWYQGEQDIILRTLEDLRSEIE